MSAIQREQAFSPAALLVLKLFAFGVMVLDHADMFLGAGQGVHATLGRVVFPIFGVILAYNLARVDVERIIRELLPRAVLVGVIAQVSYSMLQGDVLPLNILFTLAAAMLVYASIELREYAPALVLLVIAGFFVDYAWPGVLGVVLVAIAFKRQPERWISAATMFTIALVLWNGYAWALLAVPIMMLVSIFAKGDAPRMKWLFWAGYPAHLAILAVFKVL